MGIKRLTIPLGINLFLLFIMMGIIFLFSAQPAVESAQISGFFAGKLLHLLEQVSGQTASDGLKTIFSELDHYVRKFGHFTEYFILGLLAAGFFSRFFREKKWRLHLALSLPFCILYAASDEVHQMFVPGRGPGVGDVLLDSISAAAAITLVLFLNGRKSRKV